MTKKLPDETRRRKVTEADLVAFARREHLRLFSVPWEQDLESKLLNYGEAHLEREDSLGNEFIDVEAEQRRAAERRLIGADIAEALTADRKRVSAALDELRRVVLDLDRLSAELTEKWIDSDGVDEQGRLNFLGLSPGGFLEGALVDLPVRDEDPPWRLEPIPNATDVIARTAQEHYGEILGRPPTNHELGIVAILCGLRGGPAGSVSEVVKRSADAMRRARGRIESSKT